MNTGLWMLEDMGAAGYRWDTTSDHLDWWGLETLGGVGASLSTGGAFLSSIEADRCFDHRLILDKVRSSKPTGRIPYVFHYHWKPPGFDSQVTVEDVGTCHSDKHGKICKLVGMIRPLGNSVFSSTAGNFENVVSTTNRARLLQSLRSGIEALKPGTVAFTFLLASVDRLPAINESYGFEVADEVLSQVIRRSESTMRSGDFLARISGNKFGILLNDCDEAGALLVGDRLMSVVREHVIETSVGPVQATISLGAAVVPRHAATMGELFARTNEALRDARSLSDVMVMFRRSAASTSVREESRNWATEVVAALNERRFRLRYQPIVAAGCEEPAYYEALLRLFKSDGTVVPAGKFFPIADRLGLGRLIDHRVLELVMSELKLYSGLRLTMNIAPSTANDPAWLQSLRSHVLENPDIRGRLTIELTENAVIENTSKIRDFISAVNELNCEVAIDDFGAGYTSFGVLRDLPVQLVKIDGSYIRDLTNNPQNQVFVKALISIANSIGAKIVAEWVQTAEVVDLLKSWGVNYFQGEYFGRDQDILDCILLKDVETPADIETRTNQAESA